MTLHRVPQHRPVEGTAVASDRGSTVERLLVCIGPSPTSADVIRAASRIASSLHADWIAVHAESRHHDADAELRIARHLRLAETLGASTAVLPPGDIADRILECARARAVTRIMIGKTMRRPWYQRFESSLVARVIARSGSIDVHVVRTADDPLAGARRSRWSPLRARNYLGAAAVLAAATLVAAGFDALGLTEANLTLIYLLAVTAVAAWFGRGPAAAASVAAVVSFNFFFTAPRFTLRVHDPGYLFTFAVMLAIGLVVSHLTARIAEQSRATSQRERKTEHLHQLSLSLSAATGQMQILAAAATHLESLLGCEGCFLMPGDDGALRPAVTEAAAAESAQRQDAVAVGSWVFRHGRAAGAGTDTHAESPWWCMPLHTPAGVIGVLALHAPDPETLLLPDRRRLIEAFSAHVALALQRDRLTEQVHRTIAQAENERLRSALLSSVSHDLRTPLSAITGASSSLLDAGERITAGERRDLLQGIHDEADRLTQVVENLLHMTRLESGHLDLSREWNVVEDLVGSSLTRMQARLTHHEVVTRIADRLPLIRVDGVLIDLVLCNLLDNAARYSPPGSVIEVSADVAGADLRLAVADRGCGLSPQERERVFDKFYRGAAHRADSTRGAGLGLSICAAIAKLHGGRVLADDRRDGPGACFVLCLPLEDQPPAIETAETLPGPTSRSVPMPTSVVGEDDDGR